MRIKQTIEKVPGGLMVVPLLLGALFNTLDQSHLPIVEGFLKVLGTSPLENGHYEFLRIGGFTEALFKNGALTLIALFLFCAGSQMNLRVGGKALKKGLLITSGKYLTGLFVAILFSTLSDPFSGFLGLSAMTILAAMTNSNGGMYVALTGEYGNRSDVGAVSILSLNDGPFFTLLGLGIMGSIFPFIAFIAVLLPIALGMLLGNLDADIKNFLKPGETLIIPFFAFALGAGMNFMNFFNPDVVLAGLLLGIMTTIFTGIVGIFLLKLFREKSQIAGVAEASTAGNAAATPAAIAAAAAIAASVGDMPAQEAQMFAEIMHLAAAQISISTLTTAILCPTAVILWNKIQLDRGVNGTVE
jgi:2-keto-3-deoxygluconate permease